MDLTTQKQAINNIQGDVPNYVPSELEKEHLLYIYRRRDEMKKHWEAQGVYKDWKECTKLYDNIQKEGNSIPTLNLPIEIELIETKGAEEKKVMPEVVLQPYYPEDKAKVEALQALVEHIQSKNQDSLKKFMLIDNKNIFGCAWQKIYWKESWRKIKEIVAVEQTDEQKASGDNTIPKLKWKSHNVLYFKDVCIENVSLENILVNETAETLDDVYELIEMKYLDLESAKQEFGRFTNFKYVRKGEWDSEIYKEFRQKQIGMYELNHDCEIIMYRHTLKDEYSILINGVLLTQYDDQGGNPSPYKYFKDVEYIRAICRYMPKRFYPKGDVLIIRRLKEMKNILMNAMTKGVVTNASAVLLATKEVKAQLESFDWVMAGVLEVSSKEDADATRPLQIRSDISGAMQLIDKIDEYITTITGVDTRSLLASVNETATKTADRRETSLKRISASLKLLEHDTLQRKMKIILALIRQFYEEEEIYNDNGEIKRVPKTIPVKNKRFNWIEVNKPLAVETLKPLVEAGLDPNLINLLFNTEDGQTYLFIDQNLQDLRRNKAFRTLPTELQIAVIDTFKQNQTWDMTSEDTDNEINQLEIKKELFETQYEVEIKPASFNSYSESYEREQISLMAQKYIGNPFVKQSALIKEDFEKQGLIANNFVKTEEELAQEQQQQAPMQADGQQPPMQMDTAQAEQMLAQA